MKKGEKKLILDHIREAERILNKAKTYQTCDSRRMEIHGANRAVNALRNLARDLDIDPNEVLP
jgi:hypothetical protein